ncbi:MAG TPA: alkaline phosphatase family protein [Gammaproteobacteria bacterium]|nr:alkaline phosphatase family protein [Gammaproteobacteria bacterium]
MKIKFIENLHEVLIFSFLLLSTLMIVRVSNVLVFGDWQDVWQSLNFWGDFLFRGFRFDIKLLSSVLILVFWLPVFFVSWFISERWFQMYTRYALRLFLLLLLFIVFVDIGYIFYFQRPIDVLIFGIIDDDTSAVFSTIFDDFDIVLLFALFLAVTTTVLWLFSRLVEHHEHNIGRKCGVRTQWVIWFLSFLVLFVLARGSLDSFPLQRKHASVSDNTFLNSMVMNGVFNLYYAYHDKEVNNEDVFRDDVLKKNGVKDLEQLIHAAGYGKKNPVVRTTAGNRTIDQSGVHVVFVLMEGWSSQIALAQSEDNNVLGEFAVHANEGHYYTNFFANKYATNPSIEALLLNSPITPLSQSVANETSFSLSNALPFRKKGYQTLFLSGGYSSWRNHNSFWLKQGFDRYIGRSQIESYFDVDASDNPWGVYDEYVFRYLEKSLLDAEKNNTRLFSFVLTTNNHPPVRLPATYVAPELDLSLYGFKDDDQDKYSMLTGFHYQTDQLGRFISWLKNSKFKDRVILVATGDHPMRAFMDNSANADKFLRYAVPVYFYVPERLDRLKSVSSDIVGSHSDIFPTLFELTLSDAPYYSFGLPLMEKTEKNAYGWAEHGEFLFYDGVVDSHNLRFYPWGKSNKPLLDPGPKAVSTEKIKIIKQETMRRLLKKYFLVRDFQDKNPR